MSLLVANGQLATSLTTPLATATQTDLWTLRLRNTSSSVVQVITYEVKRNGGTARTLPGCVSIPVKGSAVISNLPVESGDTLNVSTTTATNTDYDLTCTGAAVNSLPPVFSLSDVKVWDQYGNIQGASSVAAPLVQFLTAAGNTISNSTAISAGAPSTVVMASAANNAVNTLLLPVAFAGEQVTIYNLSGAATLGVFPQVLSTVFAGNTNLGNNAIYNIPAGGSRTFTAGTGTAWYTSLQSSPT